MLVSSTAPYMANPALLIRTSTWPCSLLMRAATISRSSWHVISNFDTTAPRCLRSAMRSSRRAPAYTTSPSVKSAFTKALPIPEEAPVTRATLLLNAMDGSLRRCLRAGWRRDPDTRRAGLGFRRGGAPALVPAEAHRSGAERADTLARQAQSDVRVQLDAFLLNGDV